MRWRCPAYLNYMCIFFFFLTPQCSWPQDVSGCFISAAHHLSYSLCPGKQLFTFKGKAHTKLKLHPFWSFMKGKDSMLTVATDSDVKIPRRKRKITGRDWLQHSWSQSYVEICLCRVKVSNATVHEKLRECRGRFYRIEELLVVSHARILLRAKMNMFQAYLSFCETPKWLRGLENATTATIHSGETVNGWNINFEQTVPLRLLSLVVL